MVDYDFNDSLIHQFHRASQLTDELFGAELADQRITSRQYVVLATVAQNAGVSQTKIVELTNIDRSTLADIVRRMVQNGLLSRSRTQHDARAYSVTITERGLAMLKSAAQIARSTDDALLGKLSEDDQFAFKNLLAKLLN